MPGNNTNSLSVGDIVSPDGANGTRLYIITGMSPESEEMVVTNYGNLTTRLRVLTNSVGTFVDTRMDAHNWQVVGDVPPITKLPSSQWRALDALINSRRGAARERWAEVKEMMGECPPLRKIDSISKARGRYASK